MWLVLTIALLLALTYWPQTDGFTLKHNIEFNLGVPKFDLCYDPQDAFVATYDQLFHVVRAYNYFCREIVQQCSRCLRAPLRLRLRRQAYKRLVLNHDIECINREHTIGWMSRNERFADTVESDQEGSETPSTETTLA